MACLLFRHRYHKQCWVFVEFIAEKIRSNLVKQIKELDFFSVCMDNSTDSAVLEEEMLQLMYLDNNVPVYRQVCII